MYEKVNITENHLNILSLFTRGFDSEYYIREVEKILKISPRTAQLILDDLEKKGVLESKTRGKIRNYRLKKNLTAKNYLSLTEQHKLIAFLERNTIIKELIEKISPHIKGIALVFGSYVKGIQKIDSDLDIFIAGTYDKNKIKEISRTYNIEISIKNYPLNVFKKTLREDILIKEVLKDHVVFSSLEEFINVINNNIL
jgi:predicted nucleotidyltransferase